MWRGPKSDVKTVYLTFDDGPIPEVTPFVLDILKVYNAKATFFCVGENVDRHPEIYQRILEEGHKVGNHTHRHLSGYKTSNQEYFNDISRAEESINSGLFRPPYGKIKKSQRKFLTPKYQIVMWDILSGDFDPRMDPDKCKKAVLKNVRDRSIVVFHDSKKAFSNLKDCLEDIIREIRSRGFQLSSLGADTFAEKPKTQI